MVSAINDLGEIAAFVDAGSQSLAQHTFASEALSKKKVDLPTRVATRMLTANAEGSESEDSEQKVYFRLNQTGNIYYSTTSEEIQGETKKLFDQVAVLFSAMTKVLSDAGKSLYDYDAWAKVIKGTGYFIETQKFQKTLSIRSGNVAVNTQIVQQLLPGLRSGQSMEIAKGILSAIDGQYGHEQTTETTKIAHLLFICEELFGAPMVSARLFYSTKTSHQQITSSRCHRSVSTSFEQLQEASTYMFVSPEKISEHAPIFEETPEAYAKLIEKLKTSLDDEKPE